MTPIDYRNATWKQVKRRLDHNRMTVWLALQDHGPATTRELAVAMKWEVLSVRPRITELHQLGFAVLVEENGRTVRRENEGVYRALSNDESKVLFDHRAREARRESQGELGLFARAKSKAKGSASKHQRERTPRVVHRRLGRHRVWGFYTAPRGEGRGLIELDETLKELPLIELETLTHEGLHHIFPTMSEEEVERAANELAVILWNHHYRRVSQ